MSADLLSHATAYAQAGLRVFPCHFVVDYESYRRRGCSCGQTMHCKSPGKHPMVDCWKSEATTDQRKVEQWWQKSCCNIGIQTGALSGIVVLDVDPRHNGDETLADLERRHGSLPSTWRFLTGGGGQHIIFAHPGVFVPNSAGKVGPGLDIRGDGGYIVAPPSEHVGGRRYAISVDHHPEDVPLAPLPQWLGQLAGAKWRSLNSRASFGPRKNWDEFARTTISEGGRNSALASLTGKLCRSGLAKEPGLLGELVLAWNHRWCNPPLDEDEVEIIIASITDRHLSNGRR